MSDTHLMEGFLHDLVSLPVLLKKGCEVSCCTKDLIRVELPGECNGSMEFRRAEDDLFYMEVTPVEPDQVNSNNVVSDNKQSDNDDSDSEDLNDKDNAEEQETSDKFTEIVNVNRAHELLNHPGETKLKEQAKQYGWKLTGTLKSCDSCAKSKATAKAVPKKESSDKEDVKPGEMLHIDISGPYKCT